MFLKRGGVVIHHPCGWECQYVELVKEVQNINMFPHNGPHVLQMTVAYVIINLIQSNIFSIVSFGSSTAI